jgi:hypothetical protein
LQEGGLTRGAHCKAAWGVLGVLLVPLGAALRELEHELHQPEGQDVLSSLQPGSSAPCCGHLRPLLAKPC